MIGDLKTYYYEMVLTPYLEYKESLENNQFGRSEILKKSIFFSANLYHLRENLPSHLSLTHKNVEINCPDYKILGNFVNVVKHKEITKNNPILSKQDQIKELIVVTEYKDELGTYTNFRLDVQLTLNDGATRNLSSILRNTYTFFQQYLHKNLIIKDILPFFLSKENKYTPRNESRELQLNAISGNSLELQFQLLRWNELLNIEEPIDLSDAKIKFNIYKEFEFEISLQCEKTKQVEFQKIKLTSEETRIFHQIENQDQKEKFLMDLPIVKTSLLRMKDKLDNL